MSGVTTGDSVGTMTTFTVDTRDVFTVHKAGCFHLRGAEAQGSTFDIEAEENRAAILAELDEYAMGDDIEDFVAFAPCLEHLR